MTIYCKIEKNDVYLEVLVSYSVVKWQQRSHAEKRLTASFECEIIYDL